MVLQPIRLNWHYVIWYRNFTVLLMSLVLPFILLAYWNFNTLVVLLRRHRLRNRPPPAAMHLTTVYTNGDITNNTLGPVAISELANTITPVMAASMLNGDTIPPSSRTNSSFEQGI